MGTMDSFRHVAEASDVSADVMRFTCFLAPESIPFELLVNGADVINPKLARLITESEDVRATVLSVLEPLQREGLIQVNAEDETYSTTPEVQQEIIAEDET